MVAVRRSLRVAVRRSLRVAVRAGCGRGIPTSSCEFRVRVRVSVRVRVGVRVRDRNLGFARSGPLHQPC